MSAPDTRLTTAQVASILQDREHGFLAARSEVEELCRDWLDMHVAQERQRENDRMGLVALIEGAELRRRLEAAERVVEAVRKRRQARDHLDAVNADHKMIDYPSGSVERAAGALIDALRAEDTALDACDAITTEGGAS